MCNIWRAVSRRIWDQSHWNYANKRMWNIRDVRLPWIPRCFSGFVTVHGGHACTRKAPTARRGSRLDPSGSAQEPPARRAALTARAQTPRNTAQTPRNTLRTTFWGCSLGSGPTLGVSQGCRLRNDDHFTSGRHPGVPTPKGTISPDLSFYMMPHCTAGGARWVLAFPSMITAICTGH